MMSRIRLVVAAVAAFLVASALPAIAGGWSHGFDDEDGYYGMPSYGYSTGPFHGYYERPYNVVTVPAVPYGYVQVPIVAQPRVLIVNQGPTFVPTTVGYLSPTVTYEHPRTFPYGASGYGGRAYHRDHAYHRNHAPRYHSRGHHSPGYPGYR